MKSDSITSKERKSNFELLRILLMISIPVYHLCVYSGIMYLDYNDYTIMSLLFSSGGAIVADFAFMALSSYFLIERRGRVLPKFLTFLGQVLFLWIVKELVFHLMYGLNIQNTFITDMLMPGVWWFVKVYLIILLIYPFLNYIIYKTKKWQLLLLCVAFGCGVLVSGLFNVMNFGSDIVSFLFTYFSIGYMKRIEYRSFFGISNNKYVMLLVYVVIFVATFVVCSMLKNSDSYLYQLVGNNQNANELIKRLIGKYCIFQYIMGISIFLFFRSLKMKYNKIINYVASMVFYVFLLHETVMGVFWKMGKLQTIDGCFSWNSRIEFVGWIILYLICCFVLAFVMRLIYVKFVEPWWKKLVAFIEVKTEKISKKIQLKYW